MSASDDGKAERVPAVLKARFIYHRAAGRYRDAA